MRGVIPIESIATVEPFKELSKVTKIDERHVLLGQITGGVLDLEKLHAALADIELHEAVPLDIRGQFNVAKNMALYTYFYYSLAPEVHMKTYSVMELAVRTRFSDRKTNFKSLLRRAVDEGLLSDRGFRHVHADPENSYCKSLVNVLPSLRNVAAHGSTMLVPNCLGHIKKCADFVNQLFLVEACGVQQAVAADRAKPRSG